ncbi:hypothetical protein [Roseivivax sediminis]|uniref:HdeA/HdeB family protein n=1 Tax=Roseivivax sediminis TaxID=936889 RepID=A0A1I1UTT3_9RHOB|nr:hypothetical protein [Roseivivax sediminis]SFD74221.1 hypothetical protein SAMN04515678_102513 [Roseivivax sediminis]
MTTRAILALAASTTLALSGGAYAQSSDSGSEATAGGGTGADQASADITCAEFLVLDTPQQGEILMPIMPSMREAGTQSGDAMSGDTASGESTESGDGMNAAEMEQGSDAEMASGGMSDTDPAPTGADGDVTASDGGALQNDSETTGTETADSGEDDMRSGSATAGAAERNDMHMAAMVTGVFEVCGEDGENSVQEAMNTAAETVGNGATDSN